MAGENKVIPGSDFFKSLGKLEAMARGAEQQGDEDVNKAQLFHTSSNSEKKTWPGGDTKKIGNKWDDNIGQDGTDYHPARKAIAEKTLKGIPLSPEEISIIKGDMEAAEAKQAEMNKSEPEVNLKKSDDNKDEEATEGKEKMGKSLDQHVEENDTLQKGMDVSPFLSEFAKAFGSSMQDMGQQTEQLIEKSAVALVDKIMSRVDARFAEQAEFNKSLGEVVANIGHGLAGTIEAASKQAEMPAGPPKSNLRVVEGNQGVIEKSFEGPSGAKLDKSQVLDYMVDLVEKGDISSLEVCKFESSGQIRPDLMAQIDKMAAGGKK